MGKVTIARRHPSIDGQGLESSLALTLNEIVSEPVYGVPGPIDGDRYNFLPKSNIVRICSGGKTSSSQQSSDHSEEIDQPPSKQSSTLSKQQRKNMNRRIRHKRQRDNIRKDKRDKFLSEKKKYVEFRIQQMQIKLELSEKHLKDAKEKILGASTSSSMSSHSEDLKNIGIILDEVDYFKLKISDLHKTLEIINSNDINKRLPRFRDKKTKKMERKVLRSSIATEKLDDNREDSVDVLNWDHDDNEESLSSGDEIDSDEDFIPEDEEIETEIPRKKKATTTTIKTSISTSTEEQVNVSESRDTVPTTPQKKRSRSRKKKYAAKTVAELQSKYPTMLSDKDNLDDEDDFDTIIAATSQINITKNHPWVFDLRQHDPVEEPFENKYLVVLRGQSSKFGKLTFDNLEHRSNCELFASNINHVMFIQRCKTSQMYIMEELQNSLHFSLGAKSTTMFQKYLEFANVSFEVFPNNKSLNGTSFVLRNTTETESSDHSSILANTFTEKMKDLAQSFIPVMLSSKNQAKNRSSFVINMGITSLKVHQHKRLTITGCQGPSLISMWSKTVQINNQARTSLGKFLLFLIKEVIPATNMPHIFKPFHDIEQEYLRLFANQLNITNEDDIKLFNIPAVSLLVNDILHPHCDSLNPSKKGQDYTFSITVQVPTDTLPSSVTSILQPKYQKTIPLCIVVYRRNCLYQLSLHKMRITNYSSNSTRKKMCEMLSNPYSHMDYGGMFFTKHRDRLMKPKFVSQGTSCIFKDKMALTNEAIDKCGYWSSLLHVFYMFSYINGLERNDAISFVLFFSHQCNTTIVIVKAMLDIMSQDKKRNPQQSLYSMLCDASEVYNETKNSKDVGCKGGIYQRFSPSNLLKYSESQVYEAIKDLEIYFAESTSEYHEKEKSKITPADCFKCYRKLQKKVSKLYGFGPIRSSHLIQLAALLGLIPIQFYAYMPAHLVGGTGQFWINEFNFDINKKSESEFDTCYEKEFINLQNIYGMNLTSNMVENLSCILGRKEPAKDLFYYLPWVTKDEDGNSILSKDTNIQLTFRLKVKDIRHISLVCKSNGKETIVLSSESSVLNYNKTTRSNFNNNILFIAEDGHYVNHEWIESQYKQDMSDEYLRLKENNKLPSFDSLYDEVCTGMSLVKTYNTVKG